MSDADVMTVRVRLYAMLRERAGRDSIDLELRRGSTVNDAMRALTEDEGLGDLVDRLPLTMAVNREYATAQTTLAADDELALIPPVSGGTETPRVHVRVTGEPLSTSELTRRVASRDAGAIVIFQGVTRAVDRLDYEAYTEMAEQLIAQIASACATRHALRAVAVEHRIGSVALGEASVVVAVSAGHRDEAFAGARELIDRIKALAPVWKREVGSDGRAQWVTGMAPESSGP